MKHLAFAALFTLGTAACVNIAPTQTTMADKQISAAPDRRVIETVSQFDFAETDRRLAAAIARRPVKLFQTVDHGAGARSVGTPIGASKLYIFGSPKSGTPLMMANRQMGLELPMKVLVYETPDGAVHVAYPDIADLASDYAITGKDDLIGNVSGVLAAIALEATSGN